jgi:glutamyl-tRNA synthetase
MAPLRVRFAPSPTGYLHIGGARTALFNWLYARKTGGAFLLRVEDTDIQRSTPESTRSIFEGLAWLGLDHDEPVVYQSDNAEQHRAAALRLLEEGKAYRDFTPREARADADVKAGIAARARAQTAGSQALRVNPYRDLTREESARRAAAGEPFAVRLKVPPEGRTRFEDAIYGQQERDHAEIEDLVLLRSDGHPLYNLSVVLDDVEMGITHVIRGQDHLTNTHKQLLIYQALGAPVPRFAHVPLILAPDGSKLSKRKHGEIVSLTTYRDRGFIPAAFRNFLALLGWSPGGDREILTLEEMVEAFSLEGISRHPAVFNFNPHDPRAWTDPKALWMNAEYLRAMPLAELLPMVRAPLEAAGLWRPEFEGEQRAHFEQTVDLVRQRFFTLEDFARLGRAYFADDFPYDEAAIQKNLRKEPQLKELLPALAARIEAVAPLTHETAEAVLRQFAQEVGVKDGLLINAARTALTGQSVGPSMFDIFANLGPERSARRLRQAVGLI